MEGPCQDRKSAVKEWGSEQGKLVLRRIDDILDAATLAELWLLPALRCHELKENREGQISIDLKHPYRLIIEPANNPIPIKEDGGLDRERITRVSLLEVVDTHDGKIKR